VTSQSYTRAAMLGLFGQCATCITGAGIVVLWQAKGAPSLARANAPRQGTRVLSIASGACPALGSSQPRRAPAMLDTGHGSAGASSVMRFDVAHPNASNVFKATFVLQCCIDSDARAPHCNALQPRHWRAMPDTRHTRQRQRATARQRCHNRRGAGRRQCSRQRSGWAGQCSGLAANCGNARAPKEAPREAMKNKKKKKKKEMPTIA
jgi:hypothetical protein